MKPPCIIVVQHILPALRVLVAKELVEKHGLKRVRAAEKMEVTPAAITQYLEEARGKTAIRLVEGSDEVVKIISDIAEGLARNEASMYDVLEKICRACRMMMSEGALCEMHKEILPALKKNACRCPTNIPS